MLGRVGRIAPGVELLPARALAADPVRPGAAQPRVLDRLVRVDGDMILRRALHHVEMMAHRILAREPLRPAVAVDDRAARANIAGLDHRHARSEEHTSELQSLMRNSYAVLCLKTK